ncbi:G2 M phase-specific E3 ubiquitin- ligase [Paramuricea clavata]|uniref:G2 M phase-specific E3 ubiquitin- ligase n=1 Tax=Paramuricea clavata TaxID=317549 RepID=A0A6S7FTQ2_PARCT|nr:G2 M phase-specific E3 ubiquitin- ligase [Paramuricea clavata]
MPTHEACSMYRRNIIKVSSNRPELIIDRKSPALIRNLFKKLKRGELQLCEQPDVTFVGEEGIDAKGFSKELAYMIVKGLREGNKGYMLFEGQANHMLPIHCEEHVQSKLFVYAGQLIAFAFLHGHIGFPGMSRALAKYIVSGDLKDAVPHICIKDIPDINTRLLVKEIENAETKEKLEELYLRDEMQNLLAQAGFATEFLSPTNKDRAIQDILVHTIFKSRREEIEGLREGMDALHLLDFLRVSEVSIPT